MSFRPLPHFVTRLCMEPPFRLFAKAALMKMRVPLKTRVIWELSNRPQYLLGVYTAAQQAIKQGIKEISVIEFGVAGGSGLLTLQHEARSVERETGVKIRVFGFDAGASGLPELIGDYRDHPDKWKAGDYPMDEVALRSKLSKRSTLILGNVKETVKSFFTKYNASPIGFISFDLDLYSSTSQALNILLDPNLKMLQHVPIYFDDIEFIFNHKYAGELLAIDEFNERSEHVKIDKWYGVDIGRPFPEHSFLKKMYVAHNLTAISNNVIKGAPQQLAMNK